jgi:hypothetical protein
MESLARQLWVEPVGELIIARVRGLPSAPLLRECQVRVLQIAMDRGYGQLHRVLYDALEMTAPDAELPLLQRQLDKDLGSLRFRRAIVVPDTRLADLARLAFGDGDYRVFHRDMTAALSWLSGTAS